MKTYFIKTIALTVSSIILYSCQNEIDTYNDNPNDPTNTSPSALLATMEAATFYNHTAGVVRTAAIFSQQLAGTDEGQLVSVSNYAVNESDLDNEWKTFYLSTLTNGYLLNRDFGKNYPNYNGIGQILTAINLGYVTDMWGDVPYDEAFQAEKGIKAPKYNTQEEIYQRLQSTLDLAIENLKKPKSSNISSPSNDDFIFEGDTQKWIKIAYVLKARYAMRLTEVDVNAAQKALDYIIASGITSNDDDMNTYFTGASTGLNQWYAFESSRTNYLKMGAFFVENLKNTTDPRLSYMVTKDENNSYSGNTAEDVSSINTSYIGSGFAGKASQIGIVTFAEAKFIEAEAKLRLSKTDVQTVLKEAINASVLKTTGVAATTTFLDNATATIDLKTIINQKYTALFLTLEPYNDYRRTGFPALTPNQNSATKKIPLRLPTPSTERIYNPNATVVSNLTTNVWWDKN